MIRKPTAIRVCLCLALLSFSSCRSDKNQRSSFEQQEQSTDTTFPKNNGVPSGAHYNLNIIGVPKNKSADMGTIEIMLATKKSRTVEILPYFY